MILNVVWFRRDLRLSDNLALTKAASIGKVLPICILDSDFQIGDASKVWLHHSLKSLDVSLGKKLNFYKGDTISIIKRLIGSYAIKSFCWNKVYEPRELELEKKVVKLLEDNQVESCIFNSSLLWDPERLPNKAGGYYKVYAAFMKNAVKNSGDPRVALPVPQNLDVFKEVKYTHSLSVLGLLPKLSWHEKIIESWKFGEEAAEKKLRAFARRINGYGERRNYPSDLASSLLSPHLHFGEISPNRIWHYIKEFDASKEDRNTFLKELLWREFSYYILYHFPELPEKNYQKSFDSFLWENNEVLLGAWKKGQTGYPIIDAGMRELWQTGYMHNRVRMIVASFLVKNLLIDWRRGAEWFLKCLFDADLANNSNNWQWIAGSGVDHAPYFRIFNPVLQSKKFDKQGDYIKKFVPELKNVSTRYLFEPWLAPKGELEKVGVVLGKNYPNPIVDFSRTRVTALNRYKKTR